MKPAYTYFDDTRVNGPTREPFRMEPGFAKERKCYTEGCQTRFIKRTPNHRFCDVCRKKN